MKKAILKHIHATIFLSAKSADGRFFPLELEVSIATTALTAFQACMLILNREIGKPAAEELWSMRLSGCARAANGLLFTGADYVGYFLQTVLRLMITR